MGRRAKRAERHTLRWTSEEDRLLRKYWGSGPKTLRGVLSRSLGALIARARKLGLEGQSWGYTTRNAAARVLGIAPESLSRLVEECGMEEQVYAPLRDPRRRGPETWKAYDLDLLRQLYLLRAERTTLAALWGKEHLRVGIAGKRLLEKYGLYKKHKELRLYVPVGVFEELHAGSPGEWCSLWREALRLEGESPVAPWFLCVLAYDLRRGLAGTWIEDYGRTKNLGLAREVLKSCGLDIVRERSST